MMKNLEAKLVEDSIVLSARSHEMSTSGKNEIPNIA